MKARSIRQPLYWVIWHENGDREIVPTTILAALHAYATDEEHTRRASRRVRKEPVA